MQQVVYLMMMMMSSDKKTVVFVTCLDALRVCLEDVS
jgi:hypothetical protein